MAAGLTLVTGARGFVGWQLTQQLVAAGRRVRATDLPGADPAPFERIGVEFMPADLARAECLSRLFAGEIDDVFHVGAICNFSTPLAQLQPVNVDAVAHITRLALQSGVRRYIHMGSTSIYGLGGGEVITENQPAKPIDAYGRSKQMGEAMVWERAAEGLSVVVLRPCTVYGPGCTDGAGKVFSRPSRISAIPGNGRQRLSNVRVEDVAAAALYLAGHPDAIGQAYNIADDSHPTLTDALRLAAQTFGTASPRAHLPLKLLRPLARIDGWAAKMRGVIPTLEFDSLRYLDADYLIDNSKLKATGFRLRFPDFAQSLATLGSMNR